MIRAGVGYSVAADATRAAAEATAEALAQAGLRNADAALCFASTALGGAYPALLRTVADRAGTREVAGCSAAGVIAGEREVERGPAVAVLIIGGGSIGARRLFVPGLRGRAAQAARELAAAARPALGRDNLLCLFPDTYNLESGPLLETLARELPGVSVVGGGATEDGSIGETFQFCGDAISSNSISGMLLAGDFEVTLGASCACTPLGPPRRVTAARDNLLIELDGRPAFEVFAETVGPLAEDLNRAAAFVFLGVPLAADALRLERGRYLVRNIVGFKREHGVLAVAHRPRIGELVGLLLRNAEGAREDLKATLDQMSTGLRQPPAFGLYFDCVSRGAGLYQVANHDAAYIRRYLGPAPVAGFFTGFEIGPLAGLTSLLQYTGVLALVSPR